MGLYFDESLKNLNLSLHSEEERFKLETSDIITVNALKKLEELRMKK